MYNCGRSIPGWLVGALIPDQVFFQASSRIGIVYELLCSRTMADRFLIQLDHRKKNWTAISRYLKQKSILLKYLSGIIAFVFKFYTLFTHSLKA